MVEIHEGVITGSNTTQEEYDKMSAIVKPLAQALMELSEVDLVNAMASLCLTFALRFDEPGEAFIALGKIVLTNLPEAERYKQTVVSGLS